MKTYFNNIHTLEELRKQYKELLKKYHPDNVNGSTEITQQINTEYKKLFQSLKDKHESKQTETDNTNYNNYKYDFESDEKLREVLQKIINFTNINIEIVGCWLWVDGATYNYKTTLKELGFKWASEKKKWYFHTETFRKRSKRKLSMNDIRNLYGSTEVQTEELKQLKQA